jgi:uncharacterized Zn finger protein
MKVELSKFEDKFSGEIWQRGREYYREGLVGNVSKLGTLIKAESYGNSTYRLTLDLKSGDMKCTCPCDFHCKHLAALIMWLKNNKITEVSFDKLNSMNKQELINALAAILKKHPEMVKYTQKLDDNTIKDLIKKLWFPRNDDSISLFKMLDFIKESILKKPKFELIELFVRKMIDMYEHEPDSNELTDYIDEFLQDIEKIRLKKEQKIKIREIVGEYFEDY